ncbi:hypothetical protein [Miltoncostaea oceani]|uniref:hypothetical protein n=1 Tax=Miltoncostaea oceani TaxID=2843216 RepID=UPI001C3D486A|nr:hypothetical protein [Miltoncostaea oceani]
MSETPTTIDRTTVSTALNAAADFLTDGLDGDHDPAVDLMNLLVNLGLHLADNPEALAAFKDPETTEQVVIDAVGASYGGMPGWMVDVLELRLPGIGERVSVDEDAS